MIIKKHASDGRFLIYNTEKIKNQGWNNAHTHINSRRAAESLYKNVKRSRFPKTRHIGLLHSHIRVINDPKYIKKIKRLINTKVDKKKGNHGFHKKPAGMI